MQTKKGKMLQSECWPTAIQLSLKRVSVLHEGDKNT